MVYIAQQSRKRVFVLETRDVATEFRDALWDATTADSSRNRDQSAVIGVEIVPGLAGPLELELNNTDTCSA